MTIIDGSLPSNVGGGGNVRNVLRRAFGTLQRNGWFTLLTLEGYLELFSYLKKDLFELYGQFDEYKSFNAIITLEHDKWKTTDESQKGKLDKLMKKNKVLTLEDWIVAMTSYGLSEDQIETHTGQHKPSNLYVELENMKSKIYKKAETVLYNTQHI